MKKITKAMMLMTAVMLFAIANCSAQLIVKVLPTLPPVAKQPRPPRQTPHDVWVSEEWAPNRNGYIYNLGYWSPRPRHKTAYVSGHWAKKGSGFYWVRGYWR